MGLSMKSAKELIETQLLPAFSSSRDKLQKIDDWYRWNHTAPHQPRQMTQEYRELQGRAQTPWLGLIVTAVAQALYVEGYRRAEDEDNASAWQWWQANGMDSRQIAIHRAALAYGVSYETVLPGTDEFGTEMPVIRGHSPRRMMAFYADPSADDWPLYALRIDPISGDTARGWLAHFYDDENELIFETDAFFSQATPVEPRVHGLGVCPVVRFSNQLDLEGRTPGEVEPLIPVAGRIDQTVFDRLVVQRFSSWIVRTIAGMSKPDTDEEVAATRLRLKVEDLLVSEDPDTKFGSLPATPLEGFTEAAEADIRVIAAVSQTPVHELLGQLVNLSAEALAAARASFEAKVEERKHSLGESHEQSFRLAAHVMGDSAGASDRQAQVRWADMETRSLSQAADALGKIATMLGVPVELLWERIPGWTQQDVERARDLVENGSAVQDVVTQQAEQAAAAAMPAGMPANGSTDRSAG